MNRSPGFSEIAEAALQAHVGQGLPTVVLEALAREAGAGAGVLFSPAGSVAAVVPEGLEPPGSPSPPGWNPVDVGRPGTPWTAWLRDGGEVAEATRAAARLALHVWDLKEHLRRSRFDERFRVWELEAVRSIAESVGGVLEPRKIAGEVIAHLVGLLGVRRAQLILGSSPESWETAAVFGGEILTEPLSGELWSRGLRSGDVLAAVVPGGGSGLGLLVVADKEARSGTEPFSDGDARVVELFAAQAAIALENARLSRESIERARLRKEMEVAAEIQSHLYPKEVPVTPGWRVATRFLPIREVGGDSFDVVVRGEDLLATVTDVSGKGVGAGMLAAGLHALARVLACETEDVPRVASRLNDYLAEVTDDNRFATMVMVRLGPDGSFCAVHAGHCPSLVRRRDGSVERMPPSGLPLGILPGTRYTPLRGRLGPGDLMILYTDGITEAEDPEGDELGVTGLEELVAGLSSSQADGACEELLARLERFTGGAEPTDDVTLLVVERRGDL